MALIISYDRACVIKLGKAVAKVCSGVMSRVISSPS